MREVAIVHDWGRRRPGLFAGLYFEGEDLHVGVTSDEQDSVRELRSLLPAGTNLTVFSAAHSLVALRALVERISKDMESLRRDGIEVSTVGIDERVNAVVIRLAEPNASWQQELIRRYGGADVLRFGEPGRFYTRPLEHR